MPRDRRRLEAMVVNPNPPQNIGPPKTTLPPPNAVAPPSISGPSGKTQPYVGRRHAPCLGASLAGSRSKHAHTRPAIARFAHQRVVDLPRSPPPAGTTNSTDRMKAGRPAGASYRSGASIRLAH